MCEKLIADIILSGNETERIPLKSGPRHVPLVSIIIQCSTLVLSGLIIPEKQIKGIKIAKEDIKLSQFTGGMFFYLSRA